jgi:uncharacterized small protein (DUF1192 family)
MRYRLRTLLIVLAIGPPIVAWYVWPRVHEAYVAWQFRDAVRKMKPVGVPPDSVSALRASSLAALHARLAELHAEYARLEAEMVALGQLEAGSQERSEKLREESEKLRTGLQSIRAVYPASPLPFLNREERDPPGPLRFSPEIERAMLHEGTQRK